MRTPMQVLVIPYRIDPERPYYCILKRSDAYYWHFIAGGAEDTETPLEAAAREASEEIGAPPKANIIPLTFMTYVPAECISHKHRQHWPADTFLLPEYYFALHAEDNTIRLSREHTEYCWVTYEEAVSLLHWQSNAVALYELNEKLRHNEMP